MSSSTVPRIGEAGPSTYRSQPHHQWTRGDPRKDESEWTTGLASYEDLCHNLMDDDLMTDEDLVLEPEELTPPSPYTPTSTSTNENADAKSRQNSLDFVIAAFRASEDRENLDPEDNAAVKQAIEQHQHAADELPRASWLTARRFRLRDFLPDFERNVDGECENIELGLYSTAVGEEAAGVRTVRSREDGKQQAVLGKLIGWFATAKAGEKSRQQAGELHR